MRLPVIASSLRLFVPAILAGVPLLGACGMFSSEPESSAPAVPPPPAMVVSVDFRDVHRCSRISPEITVAGAPQGTARFEVRLVEYGDREILLGGGVWTDVGADGAGVIPEGALTPHYRGPCAPLGSNRRFGYEVRALPREGGIPLAERTWTYTQE